MVEYSQSNAGRFWLILFSILLTLMLTITRLPPALFDLWPDWVPLVVIFWGLREPERVGPLVGFICGMLLAVITIKSFGVLEFGLATIVFLANRIHSQFKLLSLWLQTFIVVLMTALYKLLTGWMFGLVSDFHITQTYWYTLFGNLIIWPFLFILLHELRNRSLHD